MCKVSKWTFATESVFKNISDYFERKNLSYDLMFAIRKSVYPDDDYLYMIAARHKNNGTMTVWTCWNEKTQSLNHGHYDLNSDVEVYDILQKNYIE